MKFTFDIYIYIYDLVMPAYNATISVEYGGSDNEVSSYVTEISTVEELKLLRNSVNNGLDYKGVTVTLKK